MTPAPTIEVVLLAPPRLHPLATALRTTVERVARRPGVQLVEAPGQGEIRFVVGLEVGSCEGVAIGLHALDDAGPIWIVPELAFDRALDGLERVQRLGSVLAAALDLVAHADGREWLRNDALSHGVTHVLAGTAHLSAVALQDGLARRQAARAASLLLGALDEGRTFEVDDWSLPRELDVAAVTAALATNSGEDLSARALAAAEGLAREVAASVDQALATHGLAALIPLQTALARLERAAPVRVSALPTQPTPSDSDVRAARARLDAVPRPLPGTMALALGWSAPSGALAGLALTPAIAPAGLAIGVGAATFIGAATLARTWQRMRLSRAKHSLDRAQADLATANAALADVARRNAGPELVRGALSWFRDQLAQERQRLSAIEAHVRSLGRRDDGRGVSDSGTTLMVGDQAVDLRAAQALLDAAPEPLVQRVRAELASDWRIALPTLIDLAGTARGMSTATTQHNTTGMNPTWRAPWLERSDIAQALTGPLRDALAQVDAHLATRVARGLPVRRLAFVPAPFAASALDLRVDLATKCSGDAHLIVAWRPESPTARST